MEIKLKNEERIILAKVIAKKEAEGKAAGRKVLVKCMYSSFNQETRKDELVNEWIAFWNGKEGDPQLYTAMEKVSINAWIVIHVTKRADDGKLAALNFIGGPGVLNTCKNTDYEVNVIVGKFNKASKKIDDNNFNVVVSTEKEGVKIWHQISFKNGKANPVIVSYLEKAASYDGDMIFVTGKESSFEDKKNALTCTGYKVEKYPIAKEVEQKNEKQAETPVPALATEPEANMNPDDVIITIGFHKNDKPALSSFKDEKDISWLETVAEMYNARNDDEANQLKAIKKYLSQLAS